jgi:CHASE2 domain-containing sensor protein/signal transduction histidine kinase
MRLPAFNLTRHIALREWLVLSLIVLVAAACLGWQNGLGRLDQTFYDRLVQTQTRPARSDIVIVTIDDYSLAQLGRWPWPRGIHADMLKRLNRAQPRAVGLDLILTEPERADPSGARPGDAALARAISESRRTVLPIAMQNAGAGLAVGLPIPEFEKAAAALAHINLEIDPDGVVRSVFLREGQNNAWWPQFALALIRQGRTSGAEAAIPGSRAERQGVASANAWQRDYQMHIPYSGGSGHFKSVPFVSVLRGEVPDFFFSDKYVLIGVTAGGLSDQYPTPMAGNTSMSGVEIHANILASLLNGESIAIAKPWQTAVFAVAPALLAMLAYLFFTPRVSLLINTALFALTVVASDYALRAGVWIAPSAALIALLLTYPLWSWRRLEAAIAYLGQEFIRLDHEPHLLPEIVAEREVHPIQDLLARRIQAMEKAARRVRDLRQFISDNLDSLPDATLVCTVDGDVLLANRIAVSYFQSLGVHNVTDSLLPYLFSGMKSPQPLDQAAQEKFNWWDLLDVQKVEIHPHGIEVRDEQERDLLVKSAACHSAQNVLTGWIVSIADISVIRSAERSRDETLRFISHDMRAPQSSILALLEMQRDPEMALPLEEFFTRVEKASRKTLDLADNFVQLARAESQEYRLEEVDMQDVLLDAIDEMWAQAHAKRIDIVAEIPEQEFVVQIDRPLMTRVVINLLSNAIKYSAENTRVRCSLRLQAEIAHPMIVLAVADQGHGIAQTDQIKLFRRFQRIHAADQPRQDGVGLGLVFVKTVVERHQGYIGFTSKVGEGTTFSITLPALKA